ncbi:MAG: hypothetical protein LH473_11010 [Chitinophagales bacterium]|nr:hypothetical protein [Chitinophagales bacterium]
MKKAGIKNLIERKRKAAQTAEGKLCQNNARRLNTKKPTGLSEIVERLTNLNYPKVVSYYV